jgi:DNA-binding MarR family transcriptional regulator
VTRSWHDELLPAIIANLYDVAGAFRARGEESAASVGRTHAEWTLLSVASTIPPLTVPRAARRLGLTRQSVQRTVDALVAAGEIELLPNPDHKRSPLLQLTSRGRRSLDALSRAAERQHQIVAPCLPKKDWIELDRILAALGERLAKLEAD